MNAATTHWRKMTAFSSSESMSHAAAMLKKVWFTPADMSPVQPITLCEAECGHRAAAHAVTKTLVRRPRRA
jgi:hypothetical protein